jgi:hypothetical protein
MFTLIDYHFFIDLSRGILLFLKFISLFGARFCAFLTKMKKVSKKPFANKKTMSGKGVFLSHPLFFFYKKFSKFKQAKIEARAQNTCSCKQGQEDVCSCKAANVAALICNCMRNHKDPTDYGNAVKKSVQEIVPTGNRSVCLGKQLVNRLEFLILFHCFAPFL